MSLGITCCLILGKSLNLSGPPFPICKLWDNYPALQRCCKDKYSRNCEVFIPEEGGPEEVPMMVRNELLAVILRLVCRCHLPSRIVCLLLF